MLLILLRFLLSYWTLTYCPFTSVEESFIVQASHNIYFKSPSFDHLEFPGVVPRSFLAPLLLSSSSLFILRLFILLIVSISSSFLSYSIKRNHSVSVQFYFDLLNLFNYHLVFWSSRPISNVISLILFNIAFANLLLKNYSYFISSLVFCAVAFRCEVALLLASYSLFSVFIGDLDLFYFLNILYDSFSKSVLLIVIVDSYYWKVPLFWPELRVFVFNVLQNKVIVNNLGNKLWHSSLPFLLYISDS